MTETSANNHDDGRFRSGEGLSANELEDQAVESDGLVAADLGLASDLVIPPIKPLNTPAGGVPPVTDTSAGLARVAEMLQSHTGPVAIDTERASGIRYGQRPFLVQIKRGNSPIALIDPEAFGDLSIINEALRGSEWIIHACTQDLPSLRMVGMNPDSLFDTELAGRLAGLDRVSLGAMTEELLGYSLAKEHSAADWSTRPLPEPWLVYAALDVELLADLREAVIDLLHAQGKMEWAREEFEAICQAPEPEPKPDPWRKTKGIRQVRSVKQLTALRNLWYERDRVAQRKDLAPKKLLPDSALIGAAKTMPRSVPELQKIPGFHSKHMRRESVRWVRAIRDAASGQDEVPFTVPSDSPPPVKAWASKRPEAAEVLRDAKDAVADLAELHEVPQENLLTPEHLRRLAWEHPVASPEQIADHLTEYGARAWQVGLVTPVLTPVFSEAARNPTTSSGTRSIE
ncbi:HRDC domain-containing protein [Rothia koreensis]|uniref:HRDC domain-containing protein n=1 Tax=Rothia koreensis TaxID=592378 RepID=UPI003F1FAC75